MAFLALASTDCDAGSPLTETLVQQIRTNFDDHEARLLAISAFGSSQIVDDFMGKTGTTGIASSVWNVDHLGAANDPVVTAQHQLQCPINLGGAGNFSVVYGADAKIRIDITQEYQAVIQCRCYRAGTNADSYFFGWQDVGLAGVNRVTDVTDEIGFFRDAGTGNWTFQTAKAGVSASSTGIGTGTSWGVFRITVTCSATSGNRRVKVETGTTEASLAEISGSPFTDTTKIPTVTLQPCFGTAYATAGGDLRTDYVLAYTIGRPLAA